MGVILRVVKEGGKFYICDEKDCQYGSYGTKEEAEESAALWAEYYERGISELE